MCIFEQLSGLKINFQKSELYCFGSAKEVESDYMQMFGCEPGSLPFTYLGILIHFRKRKKWLEGSGGSLREEIK